MLNWLPVTHKESEKVTRTCTPNSFLEDGFIIILVLIIYKNY